MSSKVSPLISENESLIFILQGEGLLNFEVALGEFHIGVTKLFDPVISYEPKNSVAARFECIDFASRHKWDRNLGGLVEHVVKGLRHNDRLENPLIRLKPGNSGFREQERWIEKQAFLNLIRDGRHHAYLTPNSLELGEDVELLEIVRSRLV